MVKHEIDVNGDGRKGRADESWMKCFGTTTAPVPAATGILGPSLAGLFLLVFPLFQELQLLCIAFASQDLRPLSPAIENRRPSSHSEPSHYSIEIEHAHFTSLICRLLLVLCIQSPFPFRTRNQKPSSRKRISNADLSRFLPLYPNREGSSSTVFVDASLARAAPLCSRLDFEGQSTGSQTRPFHT